MGDEEVEVTATLPRERRLPTLRVPRRRKRQEAVQELELSVPELVAPEVDIAPNDPVLAYFQAHPEPVDVDSLKLESPGVEALRQAGVKLVVPLVTQGELIGLLNLGERLSEQEYSADDRKLLENLAGQAAPALRVAQLVREQEAEVRRRERYEQEMRVATLIQQNFLPRELPEPRGWRLNAFYRPAREVGGDFYDVVDLPGDKLGIVIGDVTDKGVPAALVMASTRSVLRASAQRLLDPGKVLERVNEQLVGDMPPKMFVTCLYGVLEPATGRFVFANAGHNLPTIKSATGAAEVRATGMPLGLLPGMEYEEAEITIGPGETVVVYSDALPEAHAPSGEMYGFPRLVDAVARWTKGELIDGLMNDLHAFTGDEWEQEDDITIVTLRRTDIVGYAAGEEDVTEATGNAEGLLDDPGEPIATFTVPSQPGNERQVMERIADAIAHLVPSDRLERIKTAVAEATMNAIEHGNHNDASLLVEIRVFASQHALVVRVTDQGGGEPPALTGELPDLEAKLRGEQTPRGWGLFLIKNMVDDLHVWADDAHHTIELVVRLDGEQDG
ncbi:MAG: SpoIIE family protein phosphatase [Actinobacteria bacterium]|nr:SpoIIE family protein phosphatase [Actinomycetota bacterium]